MSAPAVSIVMPTYQGGAYLPDTLQAIRDQVYSGTVEIVAVDSSSRDDTTAILAAFGARVIVIPQTAFRHGDARNLGVQHSTGAVIVFMSQDALPVGTDWLETLVAPLADPSIGATYARQIARPNATPLEAYFHLRLYPPASKRYRLPADQTDPALRDIFFSDVCSAARREICLAHPFDQQIIMSEDQAFARSVLQAGFITYYNSAAVVSHSHHYDLPTLFRRNFDSAYSLLGIASDSGFSTIRQGIDYVIGEISYVIGQRRWRWLAVIPIYELTRTLGRLLGSQADQLPLAWRRRFSLQPGYWSRVDAERANGLSGSH